MGDNISGKDKKEKALSLCCSFCGTSRKYVNKLIANRDKSVCIYDECIELCREKIDESDEDG